MADELDTVVENLRAILDGVAGIKKAHGTPLEGFSEFPLAIVWVEGGTLRGGAGSPAVGVHQVFADVHLMRANLPGDVAVARPFVLKVWTAVAAEVTLSGACEYCLLRSYRGPGTMRQADGSSTTVGVHFEFDVKVHHSGITFSA